MINIKRLGPHKKVFEYFVDTLPLAQMEGDIQQSNDPLISKLYQSILSADQQINNPRYKQIYHKIGILGTYTLFDVCYGDYIRWILSQVKNVDLQAKRPDQWRVNNLEVKNMSEYISTNKTIIVCVGVAGIVILDSVALLMGHNCVIMATSIGAIGALIGGALSFSWGLKKT